MLSTYAQIIEHRHTLPQIQFSRLNLSSLSISLINQIPTKLIFISQLILDNNLILSLSGIDQFMNLELLSLNFNFISHNNQLLNLKNKFLLNELSFIGNQIQANTSLAWLKQQGFTNLLIINDVSKIGSFKASSNFSQNYRYQPITDHSFAKPSHSQHLIYQLNDSSPELQQTLTTKRIHPNSKQSLILNETNPHLTVRRTKDKQRFESTGDTRNRNLSFHGLHQTSHQNNSFQSSPQFINQFNDSSFQNYNKFSKQQSISSAKQNKITEFRLYPVDEQTNRDRYVERQVISPNYHDHNSSQKMYSNQQRKVNPFQMVYERPYQEPIKNHSRYQSDYYILDERGARMRTRSEQSDNNVIQREIPVYKQAIAIAFYYRNLLQKVFRGYSQLIAQLKQDDQAPQSELSSELSRQSQGSEEQKRHLTSLNALKLFDLLLNFQMSLKRYAWMKLELFISHKKVLDKYTRAMHKKQH